MWTAAFVVACCCYCFGAGAVAGRFAGAWLVVAGRALYCSNAGAAFSSSLLIERRSLKLSWSLLLLAVLLVLPVLDPLVLLPLVLLLRVALAGTIWNDAGSIATSFWPMPRKPPT